MVAFGSHLIYPPTRNLSIASICDVRISTESGVPVSTSDRTAQSNLYTIPTGGNCVGLYNGSTWVPRTFSQITTALSGLTSGRNYDRFLYDSSGSVAVEDVIWTNDTTRATAYTYLDGVKVKSGDATRRYIGTFRTTSTTTTEDSEAKRFVWNEYNRVLRRAAIVDLTTHTQTTGTVRQWRATAANQIDFVVGEATMMLLTLVCRSAGGAGPLYPICSFGINSTTVESSAIFNPIVPEHAEHGNRLQAFAAGRHFVSLNQRAEVNTVTWYQGELYGYITG